jgi:hypothetical protein
MPNVRSQQSFRFIGDEIDEIIARVEKAQARYADDPEARRAVKSAITQLKAFRRDIRKDLFLPTWFLAR